MGISYRSGAMRRVRNIFVSTAERCADERAPHCSGRTIEPTAASAAAGRALRWQVVVGRAERARRKKK